MYKGGSFCGTPGASQPDGQCLAGYYCETGVDTATPTDSGAHKGIGGQCPLGSYCPKGSTTPTPCAAGSYTNVKRKKISQPFRNFDAYSTISTLIFKPNICIFILRKGIM